MQLSRPDKFVGENQGNLVPYCVVIFHRQI
jgi:hypothetical protein